ncbi:hypothetical protein QTO34_003969 [Cnephaeus nilssonii]|uniref:Uncharacterized protein n=1 Tax=Cnephaeus nilssonii TaxID=3371016 RepID=A0AA40LJV8_CNENI|nr:hypothetical protein QTO34_003969 [Eptesicus nilssonii]
MPGWGAQPEVLCQALLGVGHGLRSPVKPCQDYEYDWFHYVDQDGIFWAANIPFHFCPENVVDFLVVTTQVEVEEIEQHNSELSKTTMR